MWCVQWPIGCNIAARTEKERFLKAAWHSVTGGSPFST
jgi:hypothetical protein